MNLVNQIILLMSNGLERSLKGKINFLLLVD